MTAVIVVNEYLLGLSVRIFRLPSRIYQSCLLEPALDLGLALP